MEQSAMPAVETMPVQETPVPEQQQMPEQAETAKTLYMFSDMEGCQVLDRNGDPISNSIAMCDPQFYSKLYEMMDKNQHMHVAFLGDYFDQGLKVIPSLKGMSMLYDKYGASRVFIILGNRDINKLRFMYELTHTIAPPTEGGWSDWTNSNFYNGLAGKENVELVKHILSTSMGAPIKFGDNKSKFVGLHSFIPPGKQNGKSDEDALAYLKASFGMDTGLPQRGGQPFISVSGSQLTPKPRNNNEKLNYDGREQARKVALFNEISKSKVDILAFYKKCKIAHVFDSGNDEKVLLAHGGGFNKGCFFNKAYVDSFGQGNDKDKVTPANYLQMMENFRRKLSQPEHGMMAETVQDSVAVYNQLLLDVVNELTTKTNDNEKYTWKFVLLQALGLKPDVERTNGNQDKIYNSLVQSCSQNGCTGQSSYVKPDIPESPDKESELYEYLQKSGITHVSYGHKPVCFPIPLMYSRPNMAGIMFISNDTSNGNRRTEDLGSTIVVGTKIDFSSTPSVASICYMSIPGTTAKKDETDFKTQFQPFLDLRLTKENAPPYDGANKLTYGNGLVVSMNAEGFKKLNFTFTPPQPAAPEGGRRSRRRRYTKKIKQRSKRRVQKKRAATRSKRERKTRK